MGRSTVTGTTQRIGVVRRRARVAMGLVLAATVVVLAGREVWPWVSLGLVAGVLVLGCLAVCVFTAITDDRAWRAVQRELDQLGRDRNESRSPRAP